MPQLTQYGTRATSWKPVTTSSSVRSTCPNCDGGCATVTVAAAPLARCRASSAVKSTSTSSSPFIAKHVAALAAERGGEPDRASAAEPLGLARAGDLDAEAGETLLEVRLLPGRAADDHAVDAGPVQAADLPGEQRLAADLDERLRPARRRVAHPLGLAAGEDDRLHQAIPASAARPMPSTVNPAARSGSGSSMLRPSISTRVRIVAPTAAQSTSASCGHSVTITTASAPTRRRLRRVGDLDAVQVVPVDDGIPRDHVRPLGQQPAREDEARRLAHVVGVRLEREPEQRDPLVRAASRGGCAACRSRGASAARSPRSRR